MLLMTVILAPRHWPPYIPVSRNPLIAPFFQGWQSIDVVIVAHSSKGVIDVEVLGGREHKMAVLVRLMSRWVIERVLSLVRVVQELLWLGLLWLGLR